METIQGDLKSLYTDIEAFIKDFSTDKLWKWYEDKVKETETFTPKLDCDVFIDERMNIVTDIAELKPIIKTINEFITRLLYLTSVIIKYIHRILSENLDDPTYAGLCASLEETCANIEKNIVFTGYKRKDDKFIDDTQFYSEFTIPVCKQIFFTTDPSKVNKHIQFYIQGTPLDKLPLEILRKTIGAILDNIRMIEMDASMVRMLETILRKNKVSKKDNMMY